MRATTAADGAGSTMPLAELKCAICTSMASRCTSGYRALRSQWKTSLIAVIQVEQRSNRARVQGGVQGWSTVQWQTRHWGIGSELAPPFV